MSEELSVKPQVGRAIRTFLHSQLFRPPANPTKSFANQTIIVTGSNVGLGFEAARHFYRLDCTKLILAVRTVSKGQIAKEDILKSVKHRTDKDAIEVWPLDLTSTESTLAFAKRVETELPRVDVLVENAGISNPAWVVAEGFEQMIQVNVINTLLLALSVLPILRETKAKFPDSSPHLVIVSSEAHRYSRFREINDPDMYKTLSDEKAFYKHERYPLSKLLEILFIRELVSRLKESKPARPFVTINLVNPGLCVSDIDRNALFVFWLPAYILRLVVGRSTAVGARTLVLGSCAGSNSHGEFMSDGKNQDVEKWIYEDAGKKGQIRAFEQTMKVLETRSTGLGKAIGL